MPENTRVFCATVLVLVSVTRMEAQSRISEDRDLKLFDLAGWPCVERLQGSARTPDGIERNTLKNRSPIHLAGLDVPKLDTAGFLRTVSAFDAATKRKRRKDLDPPEKQLLDSLEKQVVSLTAYLVLAYAGPPETTNCASIDFHDWHLELFDQPLDHAPGIGDRTPIICEITPRTQNGIFRDGIRIQKSAGFFRRPDLETESTGQPAQRVRITGFLLWDDEHNGVSDVGTTIQRIGANKYHQPWRRTAWEIHPVLKIEPADDSALAVAPQRSLPAAMLLPASSATITATASPATAPQEVTIVQPVTVKISYGETVLQRGTKLPLISRNAQSVRVKYLEETITVPLESTDLH
jgi:hypothetical protein